MAKSLSKADQPDRCWTEKHSRPEAGEGAARECSSEGTNNNGEGGEEIPRVLRSHLPGGVGGAERRKGGHRTSVPLTHVRAQAPGRPLVKRTLGLGHEVLLFTVR